MKKTIVSLLSKTIKTLAFSSAFISVQSWAANNNYVTYDISNGSDGNAVVTWNIIGGMTSSGVGFNADTNGGGFNGIQVSTTGIFNGANFSYNSAPITTTDGSQFANLNGAVTNTVNTFVAIHSSTDSFGLTIVPFASSGNYTVQFIPGSGTVYLPIAFNLFNAGTYQQTYPYHSPYSGQVFATVNVASVPEPSTYALLGLGAIGMMMVFYKQKTDFQG